MSKDQKDKVEEFEVVLEDDKQEEKKTEQESKEVPEEDAGKAEEPALEAEKEQDGSLTPQERELMGRRAQKRIQALVAKNKASEAKLAELEQKLLQQEQERTTEVSRAAEVQAQAIVEHEARLNQQQEQAHAALKAAIEAADPEAQVKAVDILAEIKAEKRQLDLVKKQRPQIPAKAKAQETTQQPAGQPEYTAPSKKTLTWVKENKWFGGAGRDEKLLTQYAMTLHSELVADGVEPDTDEYFSAIDEGVRTYLPEYFKGSSQKRQTGVIGGKPSGTNAAGKKVVKLSRSEMDTADRLGVSYADYAREKLKQMEAV